MTDLKSILAQRFSAALTRAFGPEFAGVDPVLRPSANDKFGDYQANLAMSLAKQLGQNPRAVAAKIVEHLDQADVLDKVEVAGPGFINLHLSAGLLSRLAQDMAEDVRLGVAASTSEARRVVVDYSGPNVAKEMHVGHLRSSVIGDALARVLAFQGHEVIRQNHMGDWGTQFGMLIEHLVDTGNAADVGSAEQGIGDLNAFYQQAKKRFDEEPEFAQRARQRVVSLQGGDAATLRLWELLIAESKKHFNHAYAKLGVQLTDGDVRAESFYNPFLPEVVAELERQGLARVSDGALCVFPPGFVNEESQPLPLIVRKSDGGYLYATTDLAALRFRLRDLRAHRLIYVTDARQRQHFAMVFKTAELAGWVGEARLEHVAFGAVLGPDGKPFKTRSGETVKLADLLDEAQQRALAVVTEKNPELPLEQRDAVARAVGIGAIKYADLCNDRVKDYVFAWERMLSFDGNTAPYLQNAYVRIRSIFRKAASQGLAAQASARSLTIGDAAEKALAIKLLQFGQVVEQVGQSLEPHRLCTYLYELASAYHQFYERCPVLAVGHEATRESRLALSDLAARTLRQGLSLLGIEVVEQM